MTAGERKESTPLVWGGGEAVEVSDNDDGVAVRHRQIISKKRKNIHVLSVQNLISPRK